MGDAETSLEKYLDQLAAKAQSRSNITPIEQLTYNSTASGTNYPNVTVGTGITTGTSGGIFVSPGTGTPVWQTTTTATNPYTLMGAGQNIQPGGKIVIQGEDADLVIGKKSMRDWMEKVEERLNILTPNPEMEKEWDDLRKLGERYRKLEKKCKEKSDMWNKLKAMPSPNVK